MEKLLTLGRQFIRKNLLRRNSALAQNAQTERIVALGQAAAVRVRHQPAVEPIRSCESQRAVEQNLPRRGLEQVFAAHHFGDFHGGVVGHAGKLITRAALAPPHHEIAKIYAGHKALRTEISIHKLNRFAVGNTEAPIEITRLLNLARGGIEAPRNIV